jgi:hypothetical protein
MIHKPFSRIRAQDRDDVNKTEYGKVMMNGNHCFFVLSGGKNTTSFINSKQIEYKFHGKIQIRKKKPVA